MRLFIFIPSSLFVLLIAFSIGVTRQPSPPTTLYPTPKTVEEFLRRGELYKQQGDYEKSLADYSQAAKLAPDNSDAYQGQALVLSLLDRPAESIEKYKTVRQIKQENGEGHKFTDYFIQQEEQKLQQLHQQTKP